MAGRDTESDRRAQDVAALHARGDLEDRRQNRQAPNSSPCRTACAPGLTTSPASRNQQESFASTQRPADRRAASRSNQVSQHPWDRQRSRSTQGAVTLPSSLSTFCDRRCSPPGSTGATGRHRRRQHHCRATRSGIRSAVRRHTVRGAVPAAKALLHRHSGDVLVVIRSVDCAAQDKIPANGLSMEREQVDHVEQRTA
jgi:hypothetical protein